MREFVGRLVGFVLLAMFAVSCGVQWSRGTDYSVKIPTYGAGHQPQAQTNSQQEILLSRILETLLRIESRLGNGKADVSPVGSAVTILAQQCMKCHGAEKPEGELVLVEKDGTLALLSVEQRRTIQRRINAGSMPPPKVGALAPSEKTSLLGLIGPKTEEKKE